MKRCTLFLWWLVPVVAAMLAIGMEVYRVDPFFHYHVPDVEKYFYVLDNQRSQNEGILKHFDYNAVITGTSMAENFKTSEMDSIFDVSSVKTCFGGGTYKEINDRLTTALEHQPKLRLIIRGLDIGDYYYLGTEDIQMAKGTFPFYLYDNNPFNDVEYLFNKDIIWGRVYEMETARSEDDFQPGMTSFDEYSRWQYGSEFGIDAIFPDGMPEPVRAEPVHLTEAERELITNNIEQNITALPAQYPDVDFYYFFTPYSVAWWGELTGKGTIYRQIEAERLMIELILEQPNIKLFSFNNRTDITADLNNYRDIFHYAQWINSRILKCMRDGEGLLTKENYAEYLDEELSFYLNYDYSGLNGQEDHESDFFAAALLNESLTGAKPLSLLDADDQAGAERRDMSVSLTDIGEHNYLTFYARKTAEDGRPLVCVYNSRNELLAELTEEKAHIDGDYHQYVIELTGLERSLTFVFNGSAQTVCEFKDVTLM